MDKDNFEILEHTADIRVRVKGEDLKELFSNSAHAMFSIVAARIGNDSVPEEFLIELDGNNYEELLINWLNELLSLSAVKEKIFQDFSFSLLDGQHLKAKASGFDNTDYEIKTEIKAATYHQLKIERKAEFWQAEVIFDT
ncbi:MAG: archease [Candidatus Omnitrophota bacterium]|jgi:SHS2 domain-containing protein|nr:MAG: archease [Candidatus Omnitrophota bacterium]